LIIDAILPELIIVSIIASAGGIFAYLRKKFNCQGIIQAQLNTLDQKFNAMIKINIIILEKTNPEEAKEFKKLVDLATKN